MNSWIKYTDREVDAFHPLCEGILNLALSKTKLEHKYRVEHHRMVGSLEMDFVVSNIETGKILCVVEVKRTIEAVMSTRYQLQAQGYVQQLRDNEKEKPYFILTNLEAVAFYYYSTARPNIYDQLLKPGIHTIGKFKDYSRSKYIEIAAEYFAEILLRIINDEQNYQVTMSDIVNAVTDAQHLILPPKQWHSKFAVMAYEYIRGSLSKVGRRDLIDIRVLRNKIISICKEALKVNFQGIFGLPSDEYDLNSNIPSAVLSELFDLGYEFLDADVASDLIYEIISESSSYPGEVPTDIELARAIAVIGRAVSGEISESGNICDPAAGGGNLLAVVPTLYPEIQPKQLLANEINPYLQQLLSLRLGLKFPSIISKDNHPIVFNKDVIELIPSDLANTELVLLNPPYLSSIEEDCEWWKSRINKRITEITNDSRNRDNIQMPLEGPFIDLIANLVKPGTPIICIVPASHITSHGASAIAFRQILLDKFGLKAIFCYPQAGLFNKVAQNTCVVYGTAQIKNDEIAYISSLDPLNDIDYDALSSAFSNDDFTEAHGISKRKFNSSFLIENLDDGWRELDYFASESASFLRRNLQLPRFDTFSNIHIGEVRRGSLGNFGGSDLLFIKSNKEFYDIVKKYVDPYLQPAIRTVTKLDNPYLSEEGIFFDVSNAPDDIIYKVASIYTKRFQPSRTRQRRDIKTVKDYIDILKRESKKSVPAGTVFFCRDLRRNGKAYLSSRRIFPSTNVFCLNCGEKASRFYHSWFCSIFYQLNCELVGQNRAGTRKMDKSEINNSLVPDITKFSDEEIKSIVDVPVSEFVILSEPVVRECDLAWAKLINPEKPEEVCQEAARLLEIMASQRES